MILHQTECGIIGCYKHAPGLLATHLGVTRAELESMVVTDPRKAVAMDVGAYKANNDLPGGFMVSGLVYDVSTGKIEVIVPPSQPGCTAGGGWPHVTAAYGRGLCILDDSSVAHNRKSCRRRRWRCRCDTASIVERVRMRLKGRVAIDRIILEKCFPFLRATRADVLPADARVWRHRPRLS